MVDARAAIVEDLKTTLEGINGAAPYNTKIKSVFKHTRTWNEVEPEIRPAICIHVGPCVAEHQPAQCLKVRFTVDLICFLSECGDEDAQYTAFSELVDDLFVALYSDQTRGAAAAGGGARNAVSTSIETWNTDMPDDCGQETLRMTLLIVYHRPTGATS